MMKKILIYASGAIEKIDFRAIFVMKLGVIITNIIIAAGCVTLLFPSLTGSLSDAVYYADQLFGAATRSVVLGIIAAFAADILFRDNQ